MIIYKLQPPKYQLTFWGLILVLAIFALFLSNLAIVIKIIISLITITIALWRIYTINRDFPEELIIENNRLSWKKIGKIYSPAYPPVINNYFISIAKSHWQWFLITRENLPNVKFSDILRELQH